MLEIKTVGRMVGRAAAVIVPLILSACAPPPPLYAAPPGLTRQTAATLLGSKTRTLASLLPNATVSASAIDGMAVLSGWNNPILLAPGQHTVQFGPCLCNEWYLTPSQGSVALTADFKPGRTYVMRSTIPSSYFATRVAQVWIQTSAGKAVTPRATIPLTNTPSSSVVFVPMPIK